MAADKEGMTVSTRTLRAFLVAAALAVLALPGVASAARAPSTTDRGVVQSVSATQITLRELDGTLLTLTVDAGTNVRLNGAPARLEDVRPGFVATVAHRGARPATAVRAFGTVPTVVDRGVVTAFGTDAITVRRDDGSTASIPLDRSTRFRRAGAPARRSAVRPGAAVAVTHPEGGTASVVNVLKRA